MEPGLLLVSDFLVPSSSSELLLLLDDDRLGRRYRLIGGGDALLGLGLELLVSLDDVRLDRR